MPLYTFFFVVNRIPCSALRTKDQDFALIANGLLPIPWRTKQPRLEGPSAAEVFRYLMLLDLYRYNVQKPLTSSQAKPLLAILPPPSCY